MKKKRPNPRLVKIHRSYTVEEAAQVCTVHKNTIRAWIKDGLSVCDCRRPTLILGMHLRGYLERKRSKNIRRLKPGEIYCVKCRDAKRPLENLAQIDHSNRKVGNLSAFCPDCECVIHRKVSLMNLYEVIGELEVSLPKALEQLVNGTYPSLNSDFIKEH